MSILLSNGLAWPPFYSSEPVDEGGWTREELEEMDASFCAALERAFDSGEECRASACTAFDIRRGSPLLARQRARRMEAAGATVLADL
jgi:hypothetical protein